MYSCRCWAKLHHRRLPKATGLPTALFEEAAGERSGEDDSLWSNKGFWLHFRKVTRWFSFYACGRVSVAQGKGARTAAYTLESKKPCKINMKHGVPLWFVVQRWETLRMHSLRAAFNPCFYVGSCFIKVFFTIINKLWRQTGENPQVIILHLLVDWIYSGQFQETWPWAFLCCVWCLKPTDQINNLIQFIGQI